MGQFPGDKTVPTRPQDRGDSRWNRLQLKLIRSLPHSEGYPRHAPFASQP